MRFSTSWRCAMALMVCVFVAGSVRAGGDAAFSKASGVIQREQRLIALFAHPTADFRSLTYQSTAKAGTGFQLSYRLNYVSAFGNPFYSTLSFDFDQDGNLRSIGTVATSALVSPFSAADAALDNLRDDILENNPDLRNNKTTREFIQRADARGILTLLLKLSR